ncbi:MAG: hypothetical protein LBE91_21225 [Tannerella sp.]|jgi:hypothetical protein|nr:hypothetical protein [Tannerella sp.]
MFFIGLVIIAIVLYIRDLKISAMIVFFFFVTSGFDLIPEDVTKLAFFSKGMDYAIMILAGIVFLESLYDFRKFWKPDFFTKYLIMLGVFLLLCIIYSLVVLHLEFAGVFRTVRYLFLWAAWFVFRNMDKRRLVQLSVVLFYVTVVCAVLYLLQIFFNQSILNEGAVSKAEIFGIVFPRFYNQPSMLLFFVFVAIFRNPSHGVLKIITTAILVVAVLGAFHRSLTGFFFFSLFLGFILLLPRLQRIRILTVSAILISVLIVFGGYRFMKSRTYADIQHVMAGEFMDLESGIDIEDMQKSTFTFRLMHLVERNMYLLEHPKAMLIGAGLMPEKSKQTGKMFSFDVGLMEELTSETVQVDTGDIAYSVLLIRFGYLGTALFVLPLIILTVYFYRRKHDKLALLSFSYMIMIFGLSFFSANLTNPLTFLLPMLGFHIISRSDVEPVKMDSILIKK